jgi:RNA-directed DNA polymerase
VVHHLIINKLNPLFEKAFIYDSYACRKGRGTHFGIQRIDRFIRQCSLNYTRDCYVLKLDIQGFFMVIDKRILWATLRELITTHYQQADKESLLLLCNKIITNNPMKNCIIKGKRSNWNDLPPDKSLFYSAPGCGLPIGNLSSQIFANVYLSALDHYIKHDLGLRYYGRFVDDFVLVHEDSHYLASLLPRIGDFLKSKLKLTLHPRKIYLQHYSKGAPFLGVVLKPHCVYAGRRIKGNFYDAITKHIAVVKDHKPTKEEQMAFLCSINAYLGILSRYQTYRPRRSMLKKHLSIWWWNLMFFSNGCAKLVAKQRAVR